MTGEEDLNRLKKELDRAQQLRSQAETEQRFYEEQLQQVLAEIREMGVEPEQLDAEIQKLEAELEGLREEIESLIPWDLLRQEGES